MNHFLYLPGDKAINEIHANMEGGGVAGQTRRPAEREGRREVGADDRKEGTEETMGEQRAFYMWAKRRGRANPDRAGLNRKRKRTGTETKSTSQKFTILYL